MEDVKKAVFELSADSGSGPDSMIGIFYQTPPKSITDTNLVLLPKKNNIETFANMRQISLSNFINKGRCIIENVLITQEVVSNIRLRGKLANVVLKLDMAKSYDRVSWMFLIRVLRKMGFAEAFIDTVWRLIANNWYSIFLNGQAFGFLHSIKGVKQGEPLSPALFILSAEVLSRALNSLFENNDFRSYGMPKWSANLNHLAYADDAIIFAYADSKSLELIIGVLHDYEQISGQLINKIKSSFYVYNKISNVLIQLVENITGFSRGIFPFTYLGCPVTHSRKRKADYNELIRKGGVGFRSLFDVSKALCAKIWWKFRTTNTLWANYIWIKYCKRHSLQNVQWKGGSQVGKVILEARDNIEHEIWWEPKSGTANVWFGNWTKLGALYHNAPDEFVIDEGVQDVKELLLQQGWNIGKLQQLFPMDIVGHILEELHFHEPTEEWDRSRWMMTASSKFTVGTAWEFLRRKATKSDLFKNMWISGVLFMISFFFWRLWKFKLLVGEVVRRIGIDTEARCYCCDHRQYETVDHLFVIGNVATKVWTYAKTVVGITIQFQQVKQVLQSYSNEYHVADMKVEEYSFTWWEDVHQQGWFKCNSDGDSRGNLEPSSVAFCIRNATGIHQFDSFNSLPMKARQILNTEKAQIPYMGIRQAKDHHIPRD
ncbi:uncharacterized protein LOC132637695 [Lycium barbarum]|uniref:uncharacterized protein LOC132637695 n=1 Tax=Lycium barbarum TaxID=112863 RepID=UPI00293E891E|nr:uncharacterized protein LOC132637695 [Lycium barbarum]